MYLSEKQQEQQAKLYDMCATVIAMLALALLAAAVGAVLGLRKHSSNTASESAGAQQSSAEVRLRYAAEVAVHLFLLISVAVALAFSDAFKEVYGVESERRYEHDHIKQLRQHRSAMVGSAILVAVLWIGVIISISGGRRWVNLWERIDKFDFKVMYLLAFCSVMSIWLLAVIQASDTMIAIEKSSEMTNDSSIETKNVTVGWVGPAIVGIVVGICLILAWLYYNNYMNLAEKTQIRK